MDPSRNRGCLLLPRPGEDYPDSEGWKAAGKILPGSAERNRANTGPSWLCILELHPLRRTFAESRTSKPKFRILSAKEDCR